MSQIARLGLGALLSLLATTGQGNDAPLSPYEATYRTKVAGFTVELKRTLTESAAGYHLNQSAKKGFLVKLSEDSDFTVNDDQIVGEHFVYQLSGISNRRREVIFDADAGLIRSLRKKQWTEHPWSPDVLDRLSQQEQMRLLLLRAGQPPARMSLSIVDGPKIKLKHFDLVEIGTLNTALGELKTAHYRLQYDDPNERSSDTWLAVEHSFLMVRTEHVERGDKTVIEIVDASIGGTPITP